VREFDLIQHWIFDEQAFFISVLRPLRLAPGVRRRSSGCPLSAPPLTYGSNTFSS